MNESAGNQRKRYVDNPKDISKPTCLINGTGNSSDECKVLGDFGSKYATITPTKDRGNDPEIRNKFNRQKEKKMLLLTMQWMKDSRKKIIK